jgi:hypothetical protein
MTMNPAIGDEDADGIDDSQDDFDHDDLTHLQEFRVRGATVPVLRFG